MTTPFWCLVIVAVIPFVLAGIGGYLRIQQLGSLDNNHPRIQAQQLEGVAARTYAAQQNAWEALPLFTAAVVVAHLGGANPGTAATASIVFVAARVIHAGLYIANLATLRSIIFFFALGAALTMFGSAILA